MDLRSFIHANHPAIVDEWTAFAATLLPSVGMSLERLRDHADEILASIEHDMETTQTAGEQLEKGRGHGKAHAMRSVANLHANLRRDESFTLREIVAEYRALRASVLRLWERCGEIDAHGVTRFNEAIDEALAEAADWFTRHGEELDAARPRSEARIRKLAQTTSQIVWTTDLDGVPNSDWPGWRAFTGQTKEEIASCKGWSAIHPDDRERVADLWQRALSDRHPFEVECRLRRHDGVYVPMMVIGAPVVDEHGKISEWIGTMVEATERVKLVESERDARRQADLARQQDSILDKITRELVGDVGCASSGLARLAHLVVPTLADWCVVYIQNDDRSIHPIAVEHADPERARAGMELLQRYPVDPDLGWGVAAAFRSGQANIVECITDAMLVEVAESPEQLEELRASQMTSHMAVPMKVQSRVVGCLSLSHAESRRHFGDEDIALFEKIAIRAALLIHQARLLEITRIARAEAEKANRAKDEFLAMLGHELRNPLSPILTALELMRLRGVGGEKERDIIERQVKHLVSLVDDLLDVSRITSGKIALKKERAELTDIVAKAIETSSPLLESREHQLVVSVPKGLEIDGDPMRLAQVIANLLTNAAKYSGRGASITVHAERVQDEAVISVRDNGIGIAPEMLPKIFDLFVQERQALDRSQGGLGLGLAIVRSLVTMHGGTVTASSEGRGKGAEFTVRLPLAKSRAIAAASTEPPAQPSVHAHRVLVVDDNEDAAELIAGSLARLGHDTRIAHDGPSALSIAKEFMPEVALLDIGLPAMDGYELAGLLRRQPGLEHLKLVAVTGYGQPSDRERSRSAGFDAHLVKPVSIEHIEAAIGSPASHGAPRSEPAAIHA